MLQFMPVTSVIRKVLEGSGECSIVNWRFLGLAMSEWVLLWALALGAFGVLVNGWLGRVKSTG
ncbi:disulfide bond formation protein B [mine drainage metagenome]|uniref:Disulfide bond formation protein B n=1 Tax=mine drainage metagenome TaxID=410659 RepID=T0YB92_9ZZZZ